MSEDCEYVLEPLREGADFTLYRGTRTGDGMAVLALAVAADSPSPHHLQRLRHEYTLAREPAASWAARPLALARHEGRAILVLEDPGGAPLDGLIGRARGHPIDVPRFLRIAI